MKLPFCMLRDMVYERKTRLRPHYNAGDKPKNKVAFSPPDNDFFAVCQRSLAANFLLNFRPNSQKNKNK